ncbi:MAG: ABC-F family ATP-binding cassette domain-containing protein [Proteobacteria bacterium]|nr:ABC-F family ATP-binding cassette domain-containing protein [Pseudomonadota bacterium]MBU1416866.1 ABC-F family ATP-binding cassette domain-containing protein [Pseudomonadota bacterium]MBU1454696.1 ABC-F family ATP-binding cassette domain-containing protein [Pseudomonadota bacterium]
MLSLNHLDVRYGEKHLFKDLSVQVHEGNRIGLLGVNGAGKSTLLKIMAGVSTCDDGVLSRAKYFSVAYLPQESSALVSGQTLYEEAESAFAELLELQKEADRLHQDLASVDHQSEEFAQMLQRQGEIQHRLEGSGIYTMRARIEKILLGLGFHQDDMDKPASSFSGGWIMRLMLAKMLLAAPSLLLLDEPTNHLDLSSLTWVEDFLRSYKGAMVIISHDRTFLDKVTTTTWELSQGRLSIYKGNYSYYEKEKAERRTIEKAAYDNQQAQIKQTMRFVDRFRSKSTKAKQVQSRVKQLEKMDLIEIGDEDRQIRFSFPPAPASGRDVLQVEHLYKSFAGKDVFKDVSFQFQRGDKVAMVGVNGAGKSTLLKIISGVIPMDSGEVKLGYNVQLSYFGQHQAQELSPSLTALETLSLSVKDMPVTRIRSLLGAFLFRGEEVDKKVSVLSGGEKSRLALAKMIATPANCMLLDEPTNHLDMSSQEVLQEAMAQYDGFVLVVSHNRYFLDSFVNKVVEVKDGRVAVYEGNISDYLQKIEGEAAEQESTEKKESVSSSSPKEDTPHSQGSRKEKRKQEAHDRKERNRKIGPWKKKAEEAEKQVEKLENEKIELEALMADPDLYQDQKAWTATSHDYDECVSRLEHWYEKWETAQGEIERLEEE